MTIVWIILGIIAYMLVGAILARLGDLYFGCNFEEDESNVGIAAMWPILLLLLIIYGAWKCIDGFANRIADFFVELVKHIRNRYKKQMED